MRSFTQGLRVAVLSVLFAVCCMPALRAYAASPQADQKISISVKDMPLREFLANVEQKCDYTFFYSSSVLENAGNVTVNAENETVGEILKQVLDGTGRTFEIVGDKIAIKLAPKSKGQAAANTDVQNTATGAGLPEKPHSVSGTILDENGRPMAGVGVIIVGTLKGTVTDVNGKYTISATPSQELQFSFLGYKDEVVKVGARTDISLSMTDSAQALESVVVTALGLKRDEKSLGYAATKVDGDRFANSTTASNWLNGLSGQVAGLAIDRSNSGPGGSMRVTLRGESSVDLTNNSALFVIDGVPMFNTSTASTR